MAKFGFTFVVLFLIVIQFALAQESSELSPASAPEAGGTLPLSSSPDLAPSPAIGSPASSPALPLSPVAPSPSDLSPESSPISSPPSPSPDSSPVSAPEITNEVIPTEDNEMVVESNGGMSGGKKAGFVVSMVSAACLVRPSHIIVHVSCHVSLGGSSFNSGKRLLTCQLFITGKLG